MKTWQKITKRIKKAGRKYRSNDNISDFIKEGELDLLIEEVAYNFSKVLKSMIIDIKNDPNSSDTPHRLARMYINELMRGRFFELDKMTAFPNTIQIENEEEVYYDGMLITRCPMNSMCSHHHQPIKGNVFIGILPEKKVLGLSKYSRIVDWIARRGILQESATIEICNAISKISKCKDVAVYIEARHGCCENRGIKLANSLTQTAHLIGGFREVQSIKEEFYSQIRLSKIGIDL